MNLVEMIQMLGSNIWFYGGVLLVILSVLVFVHEWGHYIIARMCGVRVEIFSIGFGKEIWGFNDSHGTRWKVSAVPLGGYVKMFGDVDPASAGHSENVGEGEEIRPMTDAEKKEAFFAKPVWQRAAVVFAGPAINYVFAICVLAGLYVYAGQPVVQPIAVGIVKDSAAEKAGFLPNDRIVSIDGVPIDDFGDIKREMMVSLEGARHFVVQRGDKKIDIAATPTRTERAGRFGFKSTVGVLGIVSPEYVIPVMQIKTIDGVEYANAENALHAIEGDLGKTVTIGVSYSGKDDLEHYIVTPSVAMNKDLGKAKSLKEEIVFLSEGKAQTYISHNMMTGMQAALAESYDLTLRSLQAIGQIVVGTRSATELGGLPRIAVVAGDMAQQGILPLILLVAYLSINLGFINLLPIPLLDGGHLLFYAVEAVIGRPIPEQMQEYAFRAGMVFIIGIMAFANINDIVQISGVLK